MERITIRSGAAEYLTCVAFADDRQGSVEMHYENENICLTQNKKIFKSGPGIQVEV